jgi:MraZ protein
MFVGEYQHSLDTKGRVILPARFREQLEGGAVMARALDECLAVYPLDEFDRLYRKLQEARERGQRERQVARTFFSGASEVTPDKQGRVQVPQKLREYAHLDKDVMVIGAGDHIEIWNAPAFAAHEAEGIQALAQGEGMNDFL